MKTWKLFVMLLGFVFVVSGNSANAQTIQRNLTATFDEAVYVPCADVSISGTWICHFTYHLDRKTGKIDQIHWNTLHADLWDTETGEKVILLDTGNDNYGLNFNWFNNMNGSNGLVNVYDVEDGWLNDVMPNDVFEEGTYVEMNWKLMVSGEMYKMSFMTQLHKNDKGEVTVDNSKTIFDCIE